MKKVFIKNVLSFLLVSLFFTMAVASSTKRKLTCNSFTGSTSEPKSEKVYVVKKDGTVIEGTKLTSQWGGLVKDKVTLDGVDYPMSELRGWHVDGVFSTRYKSQPTTRFIHGQINVYGYTVIHRETNTRTGKVTDINRCYYFSQIGDAGELIQLQNQQDIKNLVASCSTAVELVDKSDKDIGKALKTDPAYLTKVFDLYNNGCK